MAKTKTKTAPNGPADLLQKRLLALEATKDGFEGLIAELVSAATAGQLRLMSSGDQGGVDALSDPALAGARRAMQAKRYSENTSFNLNSLLGEMDRAAKAYRDIDVWLMASTKPVNGKEAQELTDHAQSMGWSFIALDWTDASGLPRLAVLCAAFPQITLAAIPGADVQGALDVVAADPTFAALKSVVLSDLCSQEVGYRNAAAHSFTQLNRLFSDAALARKIAGPSPALLAEAPPVSRPALNTALQNWWATDTPAAALIGDEGTGKTWQGLQFMRGLDQTGTPPLVVVIKSEAAQGTKDGFQAVLEALADMFASSYTKIADPVAFWRRRLHRWAASKDKHIHILVLIDGLDELDPFAWQSWLATLLTDDVASLFRVILACRRDDWRNRITVAQNYGNSIQEIPIPKFLPGERDAYLTARGIDLAPLSPKVLEAALHPRTAYHLTRMAKDLPDLSRITREQLLLRDFQNRFAVKGGLVSGDDFLKLVQNMAKQAQDAALHQRAFAITKGAVLDEVADITGYDKSKMRTVLSDLLSSDWCTRSATDSTKLEFTDKHLPDAVGMALAAEIRTKSVADAQIHLNRFLEPWGADDILEPILRMCATALMIDSAVDDALCRMILDRWFGVPFHNDAGQDFWRRVHIFRPALMLDFAEQNKHRYYNWLSEWGIACLWQDHPSVQLLVESRLRKWLVGAMLPEFRAHEDAGYQRALNRQFGHQLKRAAALQHRGLGQWQHIITTVPDKDDAYLPVQAVRTMSFLPRTPLLGIIREWALAAGAAGQIESESNLAALIRWNSADHDDLVTALRQCAEDLPGQFGMGVGKRAAATLLRLTGLEADAVRADALFRLRQKPQGSMLQIAQGEIDIAPAGAAHSKYRLAALAPFAADPQMRLTPALRSALGPVVAEKLQRPGFLRETGDSKQAVARWFAQPLRDGVAGHLLAPFPAGEAKAEERELLRKVAFMAIPGLDSNERGLVGSNFATETETNERGWPTVLAYQLSALPVADQISLVVRTPAAHLPKDYERLIKCPDRLQVEALANSIDFKAGGDATFTPLQLLGGILERHSVPGAQAQLDWNTAFMHPDRKIAIEAMTVARVLDKPAAAIILRQTGWDFLNTKSPEERFYGSDLLASLPDADIPPVLPRLHPEAMLFLFHDRPAMRAQLVQPIMAWLEDVLLTVRSSRSMGGRFIYYNDLKSYYATFYQDQGDAIDAQLKKAWSDKATRRNVTFSSGHDPVWPLLRLAGNRDPVWAAEIWKGALADNRGAFMGDIEAFPAKLAASPEAADMQREMLRRHDTDDKLYNACLALQDHGHHDLLIAEVRRYWQMPRAIEKARALVIAGFLQDSADARALWQGLQRPQAGWLQSVYDKAYAHFQRGAHSRHWARVISTSTDTAEIWTAYLLLLDIMDDRINIKPPAFDVRDQDWKINWLNFLHEQREHACTEAQKAWKDTQMLSEKVENMVYTD